MIPYPNIPSLRLGPVELHIFGFLVATGTLLGIWVTLRRAKEAGLDDRLTRTAIWWLLISGFICSHFIVLLLESPGVLLSNPLALFRLSFGGLSSYGGFLGALAGLYLFTRRARQPFAPFADVVALGLIPGWLFGRFGCYLTHDHPGVPSEFLLTVAYPGGSRHDLGFYEVLFTIGLFILFERFRRQSLPQGRLALLLGLLYAPVRFGLDFLRIGEASYAGFTGGQLGSTLLFALCLFLLLRPALAK